MSKKRVFASLLIAAILVTLMAPAASAGGYVFPSTNDLNRDQMTPGHIGKLTPHVNLVDAGMGWVELEFVGGYVGGAWFEYRIDGNIAGSALHPVVMGDLIHPTVSTPANAKVYRTFEACQKVEVRLCLGAERDWDFDWTTFNTEGPKLCELNVEAVGKGTVNVDARGFFSPPESFTIECCPWSGDEGEYLSPWVIFEADAAPGWEFVKWEICPSGAGLRQEKLLTLMGLDDGPESCFETTDPEFTFYFFCEHESYTATAYFRELGSFTVEVVKTDGGDVSSIPVTISGDLEATLNTGTAGQVKMGSPGAGTYVVDASATGYTSNGPKTVTLDDDTSDESVTITLTPVPPAPPEPGPGAIEGKAEDGTTAAGLPGVLVRLLDSTDTIIGIKMTDAAGEFGFEGLEPGDYTVRGSLDGYGADTEVAVVVNDATTEVALQLAAVIVVPPTPPAGEPVVTPPDLPKTGPQP